MKVHHRPYSFEDGPVVYPANAFDSRLRGDCGYHLVQLRQNLKSLTHRHRRTRGKTAVCCYLSQLCLAVVSLYLSLLSWSVVLSCGQSVFVTVILVSCA